MIKRWFCNMHSMSTAKTKIKIPRWVFFTYLKCHGKMLKMCVQKPKATVPSQQLYNGKGCAVKVDKIVKSLKNCTHKTMQCSHATDISSVKVILIRLVKTCEVPKEISDLENKSLWDFLNKGNRSHRIPKIRFIEREIRTWPNSSARRNCIEFTFQRVLCCSKLCSIQLFERIQSSWLHARNQY